MTARINVPVGTKFGRLTVLRELDARTSPSGQRQRYFQTVCECGTVRNILLCSMRSANTASCGCLLKEMMSSDRWKESRRTHGLTRTPTYRSWEGMLRRGSGKSNPENYRDRGITVCDRWRSFVNFLADMGERPPGMTIDRINNNGPYSPENCRWATNRTQGSNRQTNRMVILNGKRVCLIEAARILRIDPATAPDMAKREGISLQCAIDHFAAKGGGKSRRQL